MCLGRGRGCMEWRISFKIRLRDKGKDLIVAFMDETLPYDGPKFCLKVADDVGSTNAIIGGN